MSATATTPITFVSALEIAHTDALKAYRDLSGLRAEVKLESDGWHVDYYLKEPLIAGGGPHYIIDAETGAFIFKRYDQ